MRLTWRVCSRYFKRYIEREMYQDAEKQNFVPLRGWQNFKRRPWHYSESRPWTSDGKQVNRYGDSFPTDIGVVPLTSWSLFKGDVVKVLVGKDKGKIGVINSIIKERNWVYVEGLNVELRIESQGATDPICLGREKPLLAPSQIKLVDPSDKEVTDIEWRYTEEGTRVRVSVRTSRIIPLPDEAKTLDDYVLPNKYTEVEDKDTTNDVLTKVTFEPKMMTFDEEIMQSQNIVENRKRAKTYYY